MQDEINQGGYREATVVRYKNNVATLAADLVASEVPVALVFNGISHAVMLASPLNLADLARGFSLSEGIIDHRSNILDIEEIAHPELGAEVHITITNDCFMRLKERRRSLAGRTGCGLCGMESLTVFEKELTQQALSAHFKISQSHLFAAFNHLHQAQSINQKTGSVHAAAWVDSQGKLLMVREDIGRHNALDKLIGALESDKNGCVIMTSRASYELVQKCARAGISMLATISAPTSLAIRLAQQSGLTLIGFVRNDSLVVYTYAENLV